MHEPLPVVIGLPAARCIGPHLHSAVGCLLRTTSLSPAAQRFRLHINTADCKALRSRPSFSSVQAVASENMHVPSAQCFFADLLGAEPLLPAAGLLVGWPASDV